MIRTMRRLNTAFLVAALFVVTAAGFLWSRGAAPVVGFGAHDAGDISAIATKLYAMATVGYARAPEIVIALGVAALVLPIGFLLVFGRWFTRRRRLQQLYAAAMIEPLPSHEDACRTRPSARAWLEVAGSNALVAHAVTREIVRIGRDADNDLVLDGDGVEPFHAVIRRSQDGDFVIFDISGAAEIAHGGVKVNGKRPISSPLRNDDLIELGSARLTFKRRPAASYRRLAEIPDTTTA